MASHFCRCVRVNRSILFSFQYYFIILLSFFLFIVCVCMLIFASFILYLFFGLNFNSLLFFFCNSLFNAILPPFFILLINLYTYLLLFCFLHSFLLMYKKFSWIFYWYDFLNCKLFIFNKDCCHFHKNLIRFCVKKHFL